jgi:flagellar hook-associated protein 2
MTISAATTTSNPLLSSSTTTTNPLSSASSTTSNPLLVDNYPDSEETSAQQSASEQILTSLGGSSINVLGIESSLITAARAPQQKIINTAVQSLYNAQTSTTTLQQGLTALQTAADSLDSVGSLNQLQFSDSDGAVSAVAGGTGTAVQGSHQITVYQLAAAQETLSQSFSSATTPVTQNGFTLSMTIGGKAASPITIAAGQTLTQIASTINSANTGVSAQVVNTGSGSNPYSLLLTGSTGSASNFSASSSDGTLNFSTAMQQSTGFSSQTTVPQSGGYNINITSSTTVGNVSAAYASASTIPDASAYTLTFTGSPSGGSGGTVSIPANSSLSAVADAVNAQTGTTGVKATVSQNSQGQSFIAFTDTAGASSSFTATTSSSSFSIIQSSSNTTAIAIGANASLSDIVNAINADSGSTNVAAQLIKTDQGTYAISLTGPSGAGASYSVNTSDIGNGAPNLGFTGTNVQNAQDASFSVDNIQYTRSSNSVSDVLAGVSLTLNAVNSDTGTGVSTLGVTYDTTAIGNAINSFVTAFNNYQGFVASATGQTSTTSTIAGSLQNYPEVNSDLQRITSLLISPSSSASNNIKTWADLGVTIQVSGQLSFSQSAFTSAFNAAPNDVITALSNNAQAAPTQYSGSVNGLAGDVSVAIQGMTATGGTLDNINSQITAGMTDEQNQQDALNLYIQNLQTQYDSQFSSLQSILSQFSSTSSQLQQTYNPTKTSS